MSHSTFRKRQREQIQRERRLEKEADRNHRRANTAALPEVQIEGDPDLEGLVPGPQRLCEEEEGRTHR